MTANKSSSRLQITVAIIAVVGVISSAVISNWDKINPPDQIVINSPDEPISDPPVEEKPIVKKDKISSTYTDIEKKRVIQFTRISENVYMIEEPGTPWPWKGEVKVNGNEINGWARFPKSKASMDVVGFINNSGSINIRYEFITNGDGTPSDGKVHKHVWFPVD